MFSVYLPIPNLNSKAGNSQNEFQPYFSALFPSGKLQEHTIVKTTSEALKISQTNLWL